VFALLPALIVTGLVHARQVAAVLVVTGAKVDLAQLGSAPALGMLAVVTLLAIVSKLLGCGLGALSLGRKSALIVGVGMVPRGEVGIIVASLGMAAGVFTGQVYAVIIAMSLLTSVVAPPVLKALLAKDSPPARGDTTETENADADENGSHLSSVDESGYDQRR